MSRGIVRYIDAHQAFQVATQTSHDAWIVPTYLRWIVLGLAVTGVLLAVAMGWKS